METPLVIKSFTTENDYFAVKSLKDLRHVLLSETLKIWKIAIPVALSLLFQFLNNSSTSIYAGHLGDIQLSSFSIYQTVIFSIYFSLLLGMSNAITTLCGQAYGAGQFENAGIYLQRSWIVLITTCILLLPVHIFATPMLKLLGQEKEIADLAGKYSILVIPYMFSYAINIPITKYLQAQRKVNVIMYIAVVTLLIQNGLLYIFTHVFDWGIIGLAMASNTSGWVFSVALVIYIIGWCKEGWNGLSWMAFKDLWEFTKLSVGSSVMVCLEQWYSACIMLLAGHLDNPVIDVASYSICLNIQGWHIMLLLGISIAVSVRVSNTLGMSHPRAAKYSFLVTMFESLLLGIIFMTVIFLSKDKFASIFTKSEVMIHAASKLAYFLGISMIINTISQIISGVVIGCGWQIMVGYINLACYYIVGLPIGIFLGFHQHLGVKGLWGGTMCGMILQILVLLVIIYRTNWTKEVEQTANRMRIWSSNQEQPSEGTD
ncbi:protein DETOXIFICATION 35-like [Vicia villosa]|uniref:protein DETOXIFICATION 35-like n=1 Tax=Vicia villosa TaxID=3911 RepID=UPI00273B9C5F|nr:protein DETOXIFICATION 35-like [Vicia villosa]